MRTMPLLPNELSSAGAACVLNIVTCNAMSTKSIANIFLVATVSDTFSKLDIIFLINMQLQSTSETSFMRVLWKGINGGEVVNVQFFMAFNAVLS